jgi:hypothetical protein
MNEQEKTVSINVYLDDSKKLTKLKYKLRKTTKADVLRHLLKNK